jgi:hypothetical protein
MIFVPELNYWITNLFYRSDVNEDMSFRFPVELKESKWVCKGSLLDLLFNDCFDSTDYTITYKPADFFNIDDPVINRRLSMYLPATIEVWLCNTPANSIYLVPDGPMFNLFEITSEEQMLLDLLYLYKMGAVIDLSIIDWSSLISSLSKLIYLFLYLRVYNDASQYFNLETPIATGERLLDLVYEKFVINEYFAFMQNDFQILDSTTVWLSYVMTVPYRESIEVTSQHITDKKITLTYTPYKRDMVKIVYNNKFQILDDDYYVQEDYIAWDCRKLEDIIKVGDILVVTYPYENLNV